MNAVVAAALLLVSADGWVEATRSGDIVIYNREKAGSDVKEVLAVGTFDASPAAVHAVLDDLGHYKDFMPYTQESHEIAKTPEYAVTYERIKAPLADERDYTIKVTCAADAAGAITHTFSLANALGPKPIDGVVRLQTLEGHWILEPKDGGKRTKASYYVYTSAGGAIPAFIVNMANNTAVPGLYDAVRKRLLSTK